jgi:hypothetical protein
MAYRDHGNNILGVNTATNMFVSDTVAANEDGSIIERLEFLQSRLGYSAPVCIEKSDGGVLNGDDDLFTITGGPVRGIITGIVTTILGGASNGTLRITTTTPSGTTSLSTTVAIDNDAAGTSYRFIGASGTLTPVTAGAVIIDPVTTADSEFLLPIGTVIFTGTAVRTGNIKWYLTYWPLSSSSRVAAAA